MLVVAAVGQEAEDGPGRHALRQGVALVQLLFLFSILGRWGFVR